MLNRWLNNLFPYINMDKMISTMHKVPTNIDNVFNTIIEIIKGQLEILNKIDGGSRNFIITVEEISNV
jgi:hypothetical protein